MWTLHEGQIVEVAAEFSSCMAPQSKQATEVIRGRFQRSPIRRSNDCLATSPKGSDSRSAHPIDEYQLASRLSYFLWSTMPDDDLLDAVRALEPGWQPDDVYEVVRIYLRFLDEHGGKSIFLGRSVAF